MNAKTVIKTRLLWVTVWAALAGCLPSSAKQEPPDLALPPTPDLASNQADMATIIIDTQRLTAREIFNGFVVPLLQPCGACHNRDGGIGPGFLRPEPPESNDPYPVLSTWRNFIVDVPEQSQLLLKGQHEGPAMNLDQYDAALKWLQAEKKERDATQLKPFRPQVRPFEVVLKQGGNPGVNKVDLGQINKIYAGAYLQFTAAPISARGGLEISDLRLFNVKQNAAMGEQRSIHLTRPLFVVWNGATPMPDPVDTFSSTDRTFNLNQAENLFTPSLFTLTEWRAGYALSVVFDAMSLVGLVSVGNPCKAAGMDHFKTKVAAFLSKPAACGKSGCHDAMAQVAGINVALFSQAGANLAPLCEQLKFYNGIGVIEDNTNPAGITNHQYNFKWSSDACTVNGLAATCFNDFKTELATWRTLEGQ